MNVPNTIATVLLPMTILMSQTRAWAVHQASGNSSLTIYSSAQPGAINPDLYRPIPGQVQYNWQQRPVVPGYAVVRTGRTIEIARERQTVQFDDVAAYIDPTTVSFASLTDPEGTVVLEQNYQFDLVSPDKLLSKYLGKDISATVVRGDKSEVVSGTLLSSMPGQLVLKRSGGQTSILNSYADLSLPNLPEGLRTKPTLVWDLATSKPGKHDVQVAYQTEGITWWADYNLVYHDGDNANNGTLDISAWVSVLNQCGAEFPDAKLKLIAGSVHRAPRPEMYPAAAMKMELGARDADNAGFAEKSFFEYHLYTLERPTTIPDNSTKQLELFPAARHVRCEKLVMFDGAGENWWYDPYNPALDQGLGVPSKKDVNIYVRFKNEKQNGMGRPLPAGRIRVSKLDDADGSMEFIGEDVIRHTPKDEEVLVKLGSAFDIVGERVQTDFQVDSGRKTMLESFEIKVRNRKDEEVRVVVQEHMYRAATWEITKSTIEPSKLDSRTVHFPVVVKPGAEAVARYTVKYTW